MSSAFYPLGMNSWNNRLPQGGYQSWKGRGAFRNPVAATSTHIRPLTNKDYGNVFPTGFGLPRPLKQYRRGKGIPATATAVANIGAAQGTNDAIDYNVHRAVKSSLGSSLGGGNGGTGLISEIIEMPGANIIRENAPIGAGIDGQPDICVDCDGVQNISTWMPITNLTEKPQPNVSNPPLCCNQQRKARLRVLPTNTNVKKDYYQNSYMYLYNRCQTFQQREFNFLSEVANNAELQNLIRTYPFITPELIEHAKPGTPLAMYNLYVAQCNPNSVCSRAVGFNELTNPRGCKRVYYKPNNPQFAQQGAVSSSTRILKLTTNTLATNTSSIRNANINLKKQKGEENCNPATYIGNPFFFSGEHQNKRICANIPVQY